MNGLLKASKFETSLNQQWEIWTPNSTCSSLMISYHLPVTQNTSIQYFESFTIEDIFMNYQHSLSNKKPSVLFLKLVIEQCLQAQKKGFPKNNGKYQIDIHQTSTVCWEKSYVGESKVNKVLNIIQTCQKGQQPASILLRIRYPQSLVLILPKVIDSEGAKLKISSQMPQQQRKESEQALKKAKNIFFSVNAQ